jgi:hypothetical protein
LDIENFLLIARKHFTPLKTVGSTRVVQMAKMQYEWAKVLYIEHFNLFRVKNERNYPQAYLAGMKIQSFRIRP